MYKIESLTTFFGEIFEILCIFRNVQPYVYKQSRPKMAYIFTWGCSSALSVRALATELKINWESIHQILMGELGMKWVRSAWVLHFLRTDKIQVCFHACTKNLVMSTDEQSFWHDSLPPMSRGSIIMIPFWKTNHSSGCSKVSCDRRKYSSGKVLVRSCLWLSLKGMIYQHCYPPGTRVTEDYYILILDQLCIHIRKKCPELVGSWILRQNNTHPHVACLVLEYLAKHNIRSMTAVQPWFVTTWLLVIPNPQTWPMLAAVYERCRSHKSVDSSTEPDLRRGILNYDAHKMVWEDGEAWHTTSIISRKNETRNQIVIAHLMEFEIKFLS